MGEEKDPMQRLKVLVEGVSETLDADLIVYGGYIEASHSIEFVDQCCITSKRRQNLLLFLSTHGGSADGAFRIARCLQNRYHDGKLSVFIDSECKSAGTLLLLGADEIIMADRAELGPLDVQLRKKDELGEVSSGLTPMQALRTLANESFRLFENHFLKLRFRSGLQITTKSAAEIATQTTMGLFKPIYEQIDPMRLAENQRAVQIAADYGKRLEKNNLKDDSIARLISDYPSHSFVIDRKEAKELFRNVREPTPEEFEITTHMEPLVAHSVNDDKPFIFFLSNHMAKLKEKEEEEETLLKEKEEQSSDIGGQAMTRKVLAQIEAIRRKNDLKADQLMDRIGRMEESQASPDPHPKARTTGKIDESLESILFSDK